MKRIMFNYSSSPLEIEREARGLICSKKKNSFSSSFFFFWLKLWLNIITVDQELLGVPTFLSFFFEWIETNLYLYPCECTFSLHDSLMILYELLHFYRVRSINGRFVRRFFSPSKHIILFYPLRWNPAHIVCFDI